MQYNTYAIEQKKSDSITNARETHDERRNPVPKFQIPLVLIHNIYPRFKLKSICEKNESNCNLWNVANEIFFRITIAVA